jgi:hypothetical protein
MQSGLPVIATDIGEIKRMMMSNTGQMAGILIPEIRDTAEFTQKLSAAMRGMLDSQARSEYAVYSKQLSGNYSMENTAIKYGNIYDQVLRQTLYIHIGWPKTGTSAVQSFFVKNTEVLKNKYRIYYPKIGRWGDGSHHDLAFSLRENPYCKIKTEAEQIAYLEELKKEITESGCSHIVLSSECFALYDSDTFKNIFRECFQIKIIAYLRDPYDYAESIYLQNVRDHNFKERRTFSDFVAENHSMFQFYKTLSKYESIADPQDFIVKKYHSRYSEGKSIVDDFMDIFSVSLKDPLFQKNDQKVNLSIGKSTGEFKRIMNIFLKNQNPEIVKTIQSFAISNPEPKTTFFTQESINKFNEEYRADFEAILTRYPNEGFETISSQETEKYKEVFSGMDDNIVHNLLCHIKKSKPNLYSQISEIVSDIDHSGFSGTDADSLNKIKQMIGRIK